MKTFGDYLKVQKELIEKIKAKHPSKGLSGKGYSIKYPENTSLVQNLKTLADNMITSQGELEQRELSPSQNRAIAFLEFCAANTISEMNNAFKAIETKGDVTMMMSGYIKATREYFETLKAAKRAENNSILAPFKAANTCVTPAELKAELDIAKKVCAFRDQLKVVQEKFQLKNNHQLSAIKRIIHARVDALNKHINHAWFYLTDDKRKTFLATLEPLQKEVMFFEELAKLNDSTRKDLFAYLQGKEEYSKQKFFLQQLAAVTEDKHIDDFADRFSSAGSILGDQGSISAWEVVQPKYVAMDTGTVNPLGLQMLIACRRSYISPISRGDDGGIEEQKRQQMINNLSKLSAEADFLQDFVNLSETKRQDLCGYLNNSAEPQYANQRQFINAVERDGQAESKLEEKYFAAGEILGEQSFISYAQAEPAIQKQKKQQELEAQQKKQQQKPQGVPSNPAGFGWGSLLVCISLAAAALMLRNYATTGNCFGNLSFSIKFPDVKGLFSMLSSSQSQSSGNSGIKF